MERISASTFKSDVWTIHYPKCMIRTPIQRSNSVLTKLQFSNQNMMYHATRSICIMNQDIVDSHYQITISATTYITHDINVFISHLLEGRIEFPMPYIYMTWTSCDQDEHTTKFDMNHFPNLWFKSILHWIDVITLI